MPATTTTVTAIPTCNICHVHPAYADCFVPGYAWTYVCGICYTDHGCSLGLGRGQELVLLAPSAAALDERAFDLWMKRVDMKLFSICGMASDDLPDTYQWSDAYEAGMSPSDCATEAMQLAMAEMGFDL